MATYPSGVPSGVPRPWVGMHARGIARIEDAVQIDVMADLHAARSAGRTTAEAVQEVQKSRSARGMHPWEWAGFSVWAGCAVPSN